MSSASVDYLLEKAAAGERLYFDDILQIYREAGLAEIGMAARTMRQIRVPGQIVTYLVDRTINYTNVCITNCQFCAFHRPPGHPEAFVCGREELAEKIDELLALGGTRILLQGGNNPDLTLDWYTDILSWLCETYPEIERDCFSPAEIWHITQTSGLSLRDVLVELKNAGLQGLPGEGAEILDDEIRSRFSPKKHKTDIWLTVMREAQKLGLNTTGTMVIGLQESLEQRVRHLQRLRTLQDYSLREHGNGFNAFSTWTLQHSEHSSLGRSNQAPQQVTSFDYLRHVAIARLFLDNILHHQASWSTEGAETSQMALEFGLDDFGSTSVDESFVLNARPDARTWLSEREIHDFVRESGYTPARRDTAYNLLHIFDDPAESPPPQLIRQRTVGKGQMEVIPLQTDSNLN